MFKLIVEFAVVESAAAYFFSTLVEQDHAVDLAGFFRENFIKIRLDLIQITVDRVYAVSIIRNIGRTGSGEPQRIEFDWDHVVLCDSDFDMHRKIGYVQLSVDPFEEPGKRLKILPDDLCRRIVDPVSHIGLRGKPVSQDIQYDRLSLCIVIRIDRILRTSDVLLEKEG